VGAAVLSPVTDLAMAGSSWHSRAEADPYFAREQVDALIKAYLNGHDARDPIPSPLYGDLSGLPPIRVHIGDAEVLLDDSVRYLERAIAVGVDVQVEVWEGVPHGFIGGVGRLEASTRALTAIGAFLSARLAGSSPQAFA
jgi:acetyl esterase/lipase